MLRHLLTNALTKGKASAERLRVVRRVGRQTGMFDGVSMGGIRALLASRGKNNPSSMFRFHAGNTPNRTALIYRDRSYSFFEMNGEMDRVSAGLKAAGIRPGESVVLMLKNVPEFLFAQSGICRLGASAVSVSWRSTAKELTYLLENSGARAILCDASVAEVAKEVAAASSQLADQLGGRIYAVRGKVEGTVPYEDLVACDDDAGEDNSDGGAVVIYTSGTTGKPKGAVRRPSKDSTVPVLNFIGETPLKVGQTHLAVCPLYHSTAFGFVTFSYLLGSTVVLLDGFEPESFLDAVERYSVDHTAAVPTMLHRVVALGPEAIGARDTSSLKAIFTGGAPLTGTLAKEVMDALGDKLFNFYGSTETGLVTLGKPADLRAAPGTIGRAVVGNDIKLFDDKGQFCGPGEVGELYVRSGNLVEGYHQNDKATKESMKDGYFSVGDLARQDDRGYFFLEGRKRDMIISGGVNVYPREVEAALQAHPAVAEAAVIGVPDDEWGERVRAFVGLRKGHSVQEEDLLAFCRQELAGPKRPREIRIMDTLPRNPTGKVLKRQLRDL